MAAVGVELVAAGHVEGDRPVGRGHVRLILADGSGKSLKGIAFRAAKSPLGELFEKADGMPIHIAGKLKPDNWRDRRGVQFEVEDGAPATAPRS